VNAINIPLSVETVCVFTAPVFSAFAAWATYLLTKVRHLPLSSIIEVILVSPNASRFSQGKFIRCIPNFSQNSQGGYEVIVKVADSKEQAN
jgi:hypothetical protein